MEGEHFRYHPEAALELAEATQWYGERGSQLAGRFLDSVEEAAEYLRHNPTAFPRVSIAGVTAELPRKIGLQRFPYSLVYKCLHDGSVLIVAVAHDKQKPRYWVRRLS